MVARVTLAEVDTVRTSVGRAVETFEESVLPELRGEPGYEACFVLTTPAGKALVLTLWEDEQAASDSIANGLYGAQVEKFVTVMRSAPGRDSYDVAVADMQALSV